MLFLYIAILLPAFFLLAKPYVYVWWRSAMLAYYRCKINWFESNRREKGRKKMALPH